MGGVHIRVCDLTEEAAQLHRFESRSLHLSSKHFQPCVQVLRILTVECCHLVFLFPWCPQSVRVLFWFSGKVCGGFRKSRGVELRCPPCTADLHAVCFCRECTHRRRNCRDRSGK